MILSIPLQSVPSQSFSVVLNEQDCFIKVHQRAGYVYVDLSVNGRQIILGSLARDRVGLVRYDYIGFDGELMFIDDQEHDDPRCEGFNDRWRLLYIKKNH